MHRCVADCDQLREWLVTGTLYAVYDVASVFRRCYDIASAGGMLKAFVLLLLNLIFSHNANE